MENGYNPWDIVAFIILGMLISWFVRELYKAFISYRNIHKNKYDRLWDEAKALNNQLERLLSNSISFQTSEELFDLAIYGYSTGRFNGSELIKIKELLTTFQKGYLPKPIENVYETLSEYYYGISKTQKLIDEQLNTNQDDNKLPG